MSKQFSFFKKAASHATLSFFLCIDRCKMKNVQPLLLFLASGGCLLSFYLCLSFCLLSVCLSVCVCVCVCLSVCLSVCLLCVCFYETNFPYERGHSIAHSIFKTCAQQRKYHLGLFLNTNHVVEEGKMLIKLIVVEPKHFIRYKCKITIMEYFSVEVTHNLLITLMNNTPRRSLSILSILNIGFSLVEQIEYGINVILVIWLPLFLIE